MADFQDTDAAIWHFFGFDESPEYIQSAGWIFAKVVTRTILNPGQQLCGLYIVTFLGVAAVSFVLYYKHGSFGIKKFLRFCFPREIYLHPSAILDYQLYIANLVLIPVLKFVPAVGATAVAAMVGDQLTMTLGSRDQLFASGMWTNIAFTISILLVSDFLSYVNHAAHHFIPLLWPFHSVHHSAEVLTPVTVKRDHPMFSIIGQSIGGVGMGLFEGFAFYFFFGEVELIAILGVNFGIMLFHSLGSNLRHSHIWLSYGWVLNHIFISPAQHQIHHSVAPKHWNKNFGFILAIWDWMFGTLYIPTDREELVFGIGEGQPQPHSSLIAAYIIPFIDSWGVVHRWVNRVQFRHRTVSQAGTDQCSSKRG